MTNKPLTREEVLAVLDGLNGIVQSDYEGRSGDLTGSNLIARSKQARAAVEAVYAENDHLTRLVNFNAANAVIAATETSKLIDSLRAELDAAMKDADSVARLIGGQYMYHKQRFGAGDKITQAFSRLIDAIAKDRSHEA